LIRHGESRHNQGMTADLDSDLTQKGIAQAMNAARSIMQSEFRSSVPKSIKILSSPYRRCIKTATVIAAEIGMEISEKIDQREWGPTANVGSVQFKHETREELVDRITRFWIRERDNDLFIVSHGSPIAILTQLALGMSIDVEGEFWKNVPNCEPRWIRHWR